MVPPATMSMGRILGITPHSLILLEKSHVSYSPEESPWALIVSVLQRHHLSLGHHHLLPGAQARVP